MIEFNYNSNNIEGNTLTYGQTEMLLLFGRVFDEANMKDLEEMKAHNVGLKMVLAEAQDLFHPLTETFIRQLYLTLLREDYTIYRRLHDGTNTSYVIHAEQYKTRPNSVITQTGERFEYASPEETPALMTDLISWYNEAEKQKTMTPIELASLFHYRYIRIHPFEDGNGRRSRLIVNYILFKHHYPMIVVQSKDKKNYLSALSLCDKAVGQIPSEGAHAELNQIKSFTTYMEEILCNEMRNNIDFIQAKKETVWWYNGEFVTFRSDNTIKLLNTIISNPSVSVRSLCDILGINKSAVQKQLRNIQEKGYIIRDGGLKDQ